MIRRRRLGIGAELAPLVLILACLAGSFGLIVAAYRRVNVPQPVPPKPPIVAVAPTEAAPVAKPASARPRLVARTLAPAPSIPPPARSEDPTPKAIAQLTSAEAEQLLEASKANRKAQALEEARQAAVAESERWRRRQSLIHSQLDTIETKVRKAESDLDAMAFERDALEKELNARKAAVAQAKSRPSQAILPHKGPNGTWRRPIIVECRNGAAVIQPQGAEFGLLELSYGYGTGNRFVAAVAREGIRVQRQASPDGAPVVPYIFFLVRPDGIRPYYEARGRLEPLGITFGYELADSEWEVDFPDLDDTATWDGSAPATGSKPSLTSTANRPAGASSAEDVDLPVWPGPRGNGTGPGGDPSSPFTFGGGGAGPGENGSETSPAGPGGSSPPSIMGRPFSPAGAPGSAFAGLAGSGRGGSGAGSNPENPNGSSGTEPTDAGPPPAGFPGALLAGSGGGSQPGPLTRSGASGPALDRPAGTNRPRIDASGRIIPGGGSARGDNPALAQRGPGQGGSASDPGSAPSSAKHGLAGDAPISIGKPDAPPFELALDGPTADTPASGSPSTPGQHPVPSTPELALNGPIDQAEAGAPSPGSAKIDEPDPASTFVWRGGPDGDGKKPSRGTTPDDPSLALPMSSADQAAASGTNTDPTTPPGGSSHGSNGGSSRSNTGNPGGSGGSQAAKRMLGQPSQANPVGQPSASSTTDQPPPPMGLGLNAPPMPVPANIPDIKPPSTIPNIKPPINIPPALMKLPIPRHLPTPTEAAEAVQRQMNQPPNLADFVPPSSIVDRTFEVVVVCGPQGVVVQPGNYRVTTDALKDREGLFKKQVVALVKNRRLEDPKTQVEPKIRFLIQPRGFDTYRLARSQFFVSGLTWPTTTEVADPDPLVIRSRGVTR